MKTILSFFLFLDTILLPTLSSKVAFFFVISTRQPVGRQGLGRKKTTKKYTRRARKFSLSLPHFYRIHHRNFISKCFVLKT